MRTPIVLFLIVILSGNTHSQDFVEPKTGNSYALQKDGLVLLGAGLRSKKVGFIKVKIYSMALYVDEQALGGPLKKYRGKTDTPEFYQELISGDFRKEMLLTYTRDISESQVKDGMRDALKGQNADSLAKFISYFTAVKKGDETMIGWAPGGSLISRMAGVEQVPIADTKLAAKLFDIYLGKKPFEDQLKKALVSRAESLLNP